MKSKWFEYKVTAVSLRKEGISIREIEKTLNIPRSTLSGWFKGLELTTDQLLSLEKRRNQGLIKARSVAILWHNKQKELRLQSAKIEAEKTLSKVSFNKATLDLALSMLYLGEGTKNNTTALGSSESLIIKFFLTVLLKNYGLDRSKCRYYLHLRADQDPMEMKRYWAKDLGVPISCFKSVYSDQRTKSKATYPSYKGVCVVNCGNIAIQRKLKYLYNLFCKKVIDEWAISSVG